MTVPPAKYEPDVAIPPGATIRELIASLGMSQAELAERMGRPAPAINEIVHGKKAITARTAIGLARVLPYPAEFWLQLERNYQLSRARIQEAEAEQEDIEWMRQSLPLSEMHKRELIRGGRGVDKKTQLEDVLRFFGVGSVSAWKEYWGECVSGAAFAFRRSEKQSQHIGRIATWLRLGEIEAQKASCGPYNKREFLSRLRELRLATADPPGTFVPKLKSLSQCGVVVTIVKEIPGAGVSGATRWLNKNRAHIQLSLRYKTDDQLWFSFFHEAGHIVLHGKDEVFLENDRSTETKKEKEANRFAQEMLIPPRYSDELLQLRQKREIVEFAGKVEVAPGIVVGRLQFEGFLTHPQGNAMRLKRKFAWTE